MKTSSESTTDIIFLGLSRSILTSGAEQSNQQEGERGHDVA